MSFASNIYFQTFLSALLLCIYNTFIHVVTYNTYLIGEKPVDEFVENTNFFYVYLAFDIRIITTTPRNIVLNSV